MDTSYATVKKSDRIASLDSLLKNELNTLRIEILDDARAALISGQIDSFILHSDKHEHIINYIDYFNTLNEIEKNIDICSLKVFLKNVNGTIFTWNVINEVLCLDELESMLYQILVMVERLDVSCNEDKYKEFVAEFMRHYRYNTKAYNIICNIIPEYILNKVLNDYSFNFALYAANVYKYYYEFYRRSKVVNNDILSKLCLLKDYAYLKDFILSNIVSKSKDDNSHIEKYEFATNTCKPLEHLIEELDDFRNSVAINIINRHKCNKYFSPPYHILKDYIRTESLKIKNKAEIDKMFLLWQRYLDVYDFKNDGHSWPKVIRMLKQKGIYTIIPSTVADIKKDYKSAINLIESAVNMTFPD